MILDPDMDGTHDIQKGLKLSRKLLKEITSMGLAAGMEMLDPIIYNYIGDLVSWASIGARTSESQIHRQSASGIKIPVGFKNSTDGSVPSAICAIKSAATSHCYPGIDSKGKVCMVRTDGNPYGHLILRGGRNGPNYDEITCREAYDTLSQKGLPQSVIVDCSHENSSKNHDNQIAVWENVIDRRVNGEENLKGLMAESYLLDGNQPLSSDKKSLQYGVSVTDSCIGWEKTREMIEKSADIIERSGGKKCLQVAHTTL